MTPSATALPRVEATTGSSARPATTETASSETPVLAATNTNSNSSVPRYFPTRYSLRETGRAKIGKSVFSSSSR
jgi:hypothetical protein